MQNVMAGLILLEWAEYFIFKSVALKEAQFINSEDLIWKCRHFLMRRSKYVVADHIFFNVL